MEQRDNRSQTTFSCSNKWSQSVYADGEYPQDTAKKKKEIIAQCKYQEFTFV